MPNVFCVDDHALILEGLKNLLEQVEHFNWIGECNHPDKLEQILSNDRNIHFVLVDVFYNRENKLVRIGSMVQKFNQVKWIILSAYESPALVQQAFLYGVAGYLRKDITMLELSQALKLVWSGRQNITCLGSTLLPSTHITTDREALSSREMDIINLIIKGLTEQLIAESLFISKHTVHSHRKNIFRKLGIHSNSELIRYFIENPLHGIGY